jgi:hypothetical protein
MAKKSACPISRADFLAKAQPLNVTIGSNQMTAEVKDFSTGSLGWYLNGKATVEIDGQRVTVQVNSSIIVVGSKDLPRDGAPGTSGASSEPAES